MIEAATQLLVVFALARAAGWLGARAGQPAALGEMLAGVALFLAIGAMPWLPGVLRALPDSAAIDLGGEIGIFLLLLLAGIEMKPAEIVAHSRQSVFVALGGVALPFAAGFTLAWVFIPDSGFRLAQALVVGTALAITAVPVAAEILRELGLLHRPVGEVVIAAAILDDVIGLILLAVATAVVASGRFPELGELGLLFAKVLLFFVLTLALARFVLPALWRRLARQPGPALVLSSVLAVAVCFGLLASALGMHMVIGAFMAGLFFEPETVGETTYAEVKRVISAAAFGVLGPVFFASIGLRLDLGAFAVIPGFVALLIATAMLSKLIGAGLPAYFSGLPKREALAVGIGMTGRGAVELVVLSIAERAGIFSNGETAGPLVANLFSALVIAAVVTTLAMPVLLRLTLKR